MTPDLMILPRRAVMRQHGALRLAVALALLVALSAQALGGPAEAASAERILSLAPATTEILFALGAGDRVVGRTDFCRWPPEATALPSVGGYLNLDVERVLALRPDLVVGIGFSGGRSDPIAEAGIETLSIRTDTVGEVLAGIERIAARLGCSASGEALVASIQASFEEVAQRVRGLTPQRTLILVGRELGTLQGLYAAGPDSFVSELVHRAGGVNVLDSTLGPYPPISLEAILAADPDVILDTSLSAVQPAPEMVERERELYRRMLPEVAAVRAGRVILWTDPRLTVPGPSMPAQVEALTRALHPERRE